MSSDAHPAKNKPALNGQDEWQLGGLENGVGYCGLFLSNSHQAALQISVTRAGRNS